MSMVNLTKTAISSSTTCASMLHDRSRMSPQWPYNSSKSGTTVPRPSATRLRLIGVDRIEQVGSNETISIGSNRTETVGANEIINVAQDLHPHRRSQTKRSLAGQQAVTRRQEPEYAKSAQSERADRQD